MKALRAAVESSARMTFVMLAFIVALDCGSTSLWLDPAFERLEDGTADKWWAHLVELARCGVLMETTWENLKCAGAYFAIPKGIDFARAIWNGKRLSRQSRTPPPVNLPYLPELLRKVAVLTRQAKKAPAIMVGDFRHFFHQIRVSKELSEYFCVVADEPCTQEGKRGPRRVFRWSTLPMGWAWSPYVAQSVGWSVLLHMEAKDEELFLVPPNLKSLPTYIPVKGGGFVTLYYDNVFVVGVDQKIMERVRNRIKRNMSPAFFDLVEKPGSFVFKFGKELVCPDVDKIKKDDPPFVPIVYLGAAMFFRRDTKGNIRFKWQQCVKRLDEWKVESFPAWLRNEGNDLSNNQPDPNILRRQQGWWTPREVAALIGKIIWRRSLAMEPSCKVAPVISVLRRAAKERVTLGGWDSAQFVLTPEEAKTLSTAWATILTNAEHILPEHRATNQGIFIATDASDDFWGGSGI